MILGVIEGQIRGGYFPDCILDPSVVDPTVQRTEHCSAEATHHLSGKGFGRHTATNHGKGNFSSVIAQTVLRVPQSTV